MSIRQWVVTAGRSRPRNARTLLSNCRSVLGWALVVAAVPSVIRVVGDHERAWLILLVTLVPVAGVALVAILGLALARRRWPAAAVAAALVALNVVWIIPRYVADRPPSGGVAVTAMTANLQYGLGDAQTVVDEVSDGDVDVVGVTELTPRAVTALRAAGLERVLPYHVLDPAPLASGSGVWSRYPLEPRRSWDGEHNSPGAAFTLAGQQVRVQVVHPFRTGVTSAAQLRSDYRNLRRGLAAVPPATPSIVMGDFNADADHDAFQRLLDDRLRDSAEIAGSGLLRTWSPRYWIPALFHLDHVLVSEHFGALRTEVLPLPGSDHRAVLARLVLAPTPQAGR